MGLECSCTGAKSRRGLPTIIFHHNVAVVWNKSRAAILELRQMPGRETAFQFLQWLAESQAVFREQLPPHKRSDYPLATRSIAAPPP